MAHDRRRRPYLRDGVLSMTTAQIIHRWTVALHPAGTTNKSQMAADRRRRRDKRDANRIFRGMPHRDRAKLRAKLQRETAQFIEARRAA